jgi:hypothetical protein
MDKARIEKTIIKKYEAFLHGLPKHLRGKCLLTGGSAAFLYGSDRPFSDDIDFMIPEKTIKQFEKAHPIRFEARKHRWAMHENKELIKKLESHFQIHFAYRKNKPVFHSLAASITVEGISYDVVAKSVIEPFGAGHQFNLSLTPEVMKKRRTFKRGAHRIVCIPKEWLVLTKLLAGRGKELGKYDLYDVEKILERNEDFDFGFFARLVKDFCKPLKTGLVILDHHAKRIKDSKGARLLRQCLSTLR